jgi:hypothetical protein
MKYILALSLMLFTGCAVLENIDTESAGQKLAVQYSVMKYIGDDDLRAARVIKHVDNTIALVERGEVVTVVEIAVEVRSRIKWKNIDTADRLLVDALLVELERSLTKQIGNGQLNPESTVELIAVLEWIKSAALMSY